MTTKLFSLLRFAQRCSPYSRLSFCRLAPWLVLAALVLMLLTGCGDDVSPEDRSRASRALSGVMIAVQTAPDSAGRQRAADSAAQANGYDDWSELRDHLSSISFFPDDFRPLLDSTQRILERATLRDTAAMHDPSVAGQDSTLIDRTGERGTPDSLDR